MDDMKKIIRLSLLILIPISICSASTIQKIPEKYRSFIEYGDINISKLVDQFVKGKVRLDSDDAIPFLEVFSRSDLRIIRNTLYAKHGYIFKRKDLTNFFSKTTWYKPEYEQVILSGKEKKLMGKLVKIEKADAKITISKSLTISVRTKEIDGETQNIFEEHLFVDQSGIIMNAE